MLRVKSLPPLLVVALLVGRAAALPGLDAQELEGRLAEWNRSVAAHEYAAVLADLERLEARDQDPRLLNLRGVCLSGLGRDAEAVADFEAAIRRDPTTPAAHRNLAISLERLGQFGRAMSEFQQALELDAADDEARLGLAYAQIRARRYAMARKTLDLRSAGSDLRYLQARAALAEASADSAAAREVWLQLEASAPSAESARRLAQLLPARREEWLRRCLDRDARAGDCRAALGQELLRAGDARASAELLRPLLQASTIAPAALHNLLLALSQLGAADEIDTVCEQHAPTQAESWGVVALARRAAGRGAAAQQAVRKARQLAPDNLDLANLQAVLLAEVGDRADAERLWRWILERDPTHAEAKRNLRHAP
jgi:Tfp pilus assembly protein PilF